MKFSEMNSSSFLAFWPFTYGEEYEEEEAVEALYQGVQFRNDFRNFAPYEHWCGSFYEFGDEKVQFYRKLSSCLFSNHALVQ